MDYDNRTEGYMPGVPTSTRERFGQKLRSDILALGDGLEGSHKHQFTHTLTQRQKITTLRTRTPQCPFTHAHAPARARICKRTSQILLLPNQPIPT
jgi:hypothetical protein